MLITVNTLTTLIDNGGLTIKNFKSISYKTGYQVAIEGIETTDPQIAFNAILKYNGNCGIWFSNGIYYIDLSKRIKTKKEAVSLGRTYNQISILSWKNMKLIYCQKLRGVII